uniref:ATP synthase CFO B' chain subunit II n=1 Tax=Neogoniolithon spectabile TaxID=231755 RepID=A0A3G3MGX4_9FLOR|nr:ATP synthase CFO B' chain subunit II [Neogoniolithon spectabile]AYR06080.1 ATP synthase CFO B' chain subunit II [Neogoniolithon spectabile]
MMRTIFCLVISEADVASKGGIFDFNATLPLMMLQFLVLMLVMNYLFYRPVTDILDERADYIRNSLTTASTYLLRADELTLKYEESLAKARKEAQETIQKSQKEAQEIVAMNIKEAQREAEQLIYEAYEQLNIQKEKVLKTLENQVDILSNQIKSKLVSRRFL